MSRARGFWGAGLCFVSELLLRAQCCADLLPLPAQRGSLWDWSFPGTARADKPIGTFDVCLVPLFVSSLFQWIS